MTDKASTFIDNLLDIQVPTSVSLARDGRYLVYATSFDWNQKKGEHHFSTIWYAESGRANSARQLTAGFFNDRHPLISPDGKSVVFLSDRAKLGESSALYALSLSGGEPYPLTKADNQRDISGFKWSPDGKSIAFISADEKTEERKAKDESKDDAIVYGEDWAFDRLRILHVESKDVQTIISEDEHIVAFDWNDDGSRIAFVSHRSPDIESPELHGSTISSVSKDATDLQRIVHFPRNARNLVYTGNALYFTGSYTPTTFISSQAIYSIDLAKPVCTRIAYGESNCASSLKKIDRDVVCYVINGLQDQLHIVNGRTLLSVPCEIKIWDAAFTQDSDEMVIAVVKSDTNHPAEIYTTTASGGALVKLSNLGTAFQNQRQATCKFIACKSLDGEDTLDGVLLTPGGLENDSGTPKDPLPTVLCIHGGPYSRNTDSFNPSYFYFSNVYLHAGYAVLLTNYRGSSGRGERFAARARGAMGIYDHADIVALTRHCVEEGYSDRDRLIVTGWSQGGFLSYLSAVRSGTHDLTFRGAIAGAGISDWDAMTMTSDMGVVESAYAGGGPWAADKHDTRNRSGSAIWEMKEAAEKRAIPPLLILHGEKDVRVPLEQARGFRRGLDMYSLPYEYVVYPREEHDIQERKHLEDMLRRALRFCNQNLT